MMCTLGASKFWCSSQSILLFFNVFNSKLKSKAPWEVFNYPLHILEIKYRQVSSFLALYDSLTPVKSEQTSIDFNITV